jgi:hypothetical protein
MDDYNQGWSLGPTNPAQLSLKDEFDEWLRQREEAKRQGMLGSQGMAAPPGTPPLPSFTRKQEVAPSQQLAPPSEEPPRRIPAMGDQDRQMAMDYVKKFSFGQPQNVGPTAAGAPESPPTAQAPAAQPPMDDFLQRYEAAGRDADKYTYLAGLARDLGQAATTATQSGAAIRSGARPLQFGTAASDAGAAIAQRKQADVLQMEQLDPNSGTSRNLQNMLARMSPEMAGSVKGMSAAQLIRTFPFLEQYTRIQANNQNQELNRNLREYLGMGQMGIAGRRLDQGDKRIELQERPDAKTTTTVADYDGMLKMIEQIRADYGKANSAVGPIRGRWQNLLGKVGEQSPEATTLFSDLEALVAQNLYALSGKQINEAERADLRRTVASAFQNHESFEAALDTFERRTRMKRSTLLDATEASGRNVDKLRSIEPGGDEVNVIWPATGETKRIKKAGLQKAIDLGYQVSQ